MRPHALYQINLLAVIETEHLCSTCVSLCRCFSFWKLLHSWYKSSNILIHFCSDLVGVRVFCQKTITSRIIKQALCCTFKFTSHIFKKENRQNLPIRQKFTANYFIWYIFRITQTAFGNRFHVIRFGKIDIT